MKKSINTKDENGYLKTLGEINLVPQANDNFNKVFENVLEDKEDSPNLSEETWICSIQAGGTNIRTIHAIPRVHLELVAAWAETYLAEFLDRFSRKENVEAILVDKMNFTL